MCWDCECFVQKDFFLFYVLFRLFYKKKSVYTVPCVCLNTIDKNIDFIAFEYLTEWIIKLNIANIDIKVVSLINQFKILLIYDGCGELLVLQKFFEILITAYSNWLWIIDKRCKYFADISLIKILIVGLELSLKKLTGKRLIVSRSFNWKDVTYLHVSQVHFQ